MPGRNHLSAWRTPGGVPILVKRAIPGEALRIRHENRLLLALGRETDMRGCPLIVPRVHGYDPRRRLLAIQRADTGMTLHRFHQRSGTLSLKLGTGIGRMLGHLHRLPFPGAVPAGIPRDADLAELFTHVSPETYSRLSPAEMSLIGTVQEDSRALAGLLACAREEVAPCWLHGDLKTANILRLAGTRLRLMLVDWERSAPGDPARDLGSLLAEYLQRTLAPETGDHRLSPGALHRFAKALAAAYLAERAAPPDPGLRTRIGRWCGLGLLFHLYAHVHHVGTFEDRERLLAASALEFLARPTAGMARHFRQVRWH